MFIQDTFKSDFMEDYLANQEETRGYQYYSDYYLWKDAVVSYHLISDGTDDLKYEAFHIDSKIGFNKQKWATIKEAMRIIERKTCIRFQKTDPEPGKRWTLMFQEGDYQGECHRDYINNYILNKSFSYKGRNLGKIFSQKGRTNSGCFHGAYVRSYPSIVYMVSSQTRPNYIGLWVHELLHVIGIGHTQKRPDSDQYLNLHFENIIDHFEENFHRCQGRYCKTYDVGYDCNSIMHYSDTQFLTQDARNKGLKSMTAKNPSTCDLHTDKLTTGLKESDVTLIKVIAKTVF